MAFSMNLSSNESYKHNAEIFLPPSAEDNLPLAPLPSAGLRPMSYGVMIALTAASLLLSFLIVGEDKVVRSDGSPLLSGKLDDFTHRHLMSPASASEEATEGNPMVYTEDHRLALSEERCRRLCSEDRDREARMYSGRSACDDRRLCVEDGERRSWMESLVSNPVRDNVATFLTTSKKQFGQLIATLKERRVQLLILYSFACLFHQVLKHMLHTTAVLQTYLFNGINYRAFNVRTRGLNCFMYWMGRIPFGFFHGHIVDDVRFSTRQRGLHATAMMLGLIAICQSLTVIFWQAVPSGIFDIAIDPSTTALAFAAFFLYGGLDNVSQSFALWLFSVLGRRHFERVPHYVAVFRSFQGFGVALAWLLDLNSNTSYYTQFLVCAACWLLALPGLFYVVWNLPTNDVSWGSLYSCPTPLCICVKAHIQRHRHVCTYSAGTAGVCVARGHQDVPSPTIAVGRRRQHAAAR